MSLRKRAMELQTMHVDAVHFATHRPAGFPVSEGLFGSRGGVERNATKGVTLIEEHNENGELCNHAAASYTADGDLKFEAEYRRVGHLAKFDKFDVALSITVSGAQLTALCQALGNPYDMLFVIKQRFGGKRFWTIASFLREHQIEYTRWTNSTVVRGPVHRAHNVNTSAISVA